jgi:RNA polymerase sigma-B factor
VAHRVARAFAKRMGRSDLDDLTQAASLGLVRALATHRDDSAASFESWATICARSEVWRYARDQDILTRYQRNRRTGFERARSDFRQRHGRAPEPEELGLEPAAYHRLVEQTYRQRSDIDIVWLPTAPVADGLLDECRRRRWFADALLRLPDRDRQIVLGHVDGLSLLEIAAQHGISESRVCQLLVRITAQLRARAGVSDVR